MTIKTRLSSPPMNICLRRSNDCSSLMNVCLWQTNPSSSPTNIWLRRSDVSLSPNEYFCLWQQLVAFVCDDEMFLLSQTNVCLGKQTFSSRNKHVAHSLLPTNKCSFATKKHLIVANKCCWRRRGFVCHKQTFISDEQSFDRRKQCSRAKKVCFDRSCPLRGSVDLCRNHQRTKGTRRIPLVPLRSVNDYFFREEFRWMSFPWWLISCAPQSFSSGSLSCRRRFPY